MSKKKIKDKRRIKENEEVRLNALKILKKNGLLKSISSRFNVYIRV